MPDTDTTAAEIPAQAAAEPPKEAPVTLRTIVGEKLGMTQLFDERGALHGVTVIKAGPCAVVNIKTPERDGYSAICLGFGTIKKEKLSKSLLGQFKKFSSPSKVLREVRVADTKGFEIGQAVCIAERFKPGDYVDVQGVNKGHGFAGGMKRHGFAGLPASHGASDKERSPGSIASRRSLGRVIPGQRMAGRMGQETVTITKVEVLKVDPAENMLFIKGSVPGTAGGTVMVTETSRTRKRRIIVASKPAEKKGKAKEAAKPKEAPKAKK